MEIVYAFLYLWLFYALYVFTMGVYRAKLAGRLNGFSLTLLYPFVVVAVLVDLLCNLTIASIIFLEPPKELMVTTRLKRHHANDDGWRTAIAAYVCQNLLDAFDPSGDHC